jgi:hypothetical protein
LDADWSVELGVDDAALEYPWTDPDAKMKFIDLRRSPEQIELLPETAREPELANALLALNSTESVFATAKCDLWLDDEPAQSERVYGAVKFGSYIDCVLCDPDMSMRSNFTWHESLVKLASEMASSEDVPGTIEYVVRRCYFHPEGMRTDEDYFLSSGLCVTVYASGFGDSAVAARSQWADVLDLACEALLNASRGI